LPAATATPPPPLLPTGSAAAPQAPQERAGPHSIAVGSVLFYDDFSDCREGNATDWGPNTLVKLGLDQRHWLVPGVNGSQPVGRSLRLPREFYFECRFSAHTPEVTRGLAGWWKEPVSTTFSFRDDKAAKYAIRWAIRCGYDVTRLNPLGSFSLYAKKYYHSIQLPDGTASEVGTIWPTGMLRIGRDNQVVRVYIDGQSVVSGTMTPAGQLVGFEIDLVNDKSGSLVFTDFKIAR